MEPLLDICERKHGGNAESRAAFRQVKSSLSDQRAAVLGVIVRAGQEGATAKEVARQLGTGINCISGRCSELKRMGLVWAPGRRRDGSAVLVAGQPMKGG